MKYLFLSLLCFLTLSVSAHDIPLGIFNLTFEENTIQLEIKLEVEDIEKAVSELYQQKSNDRLVEQYILEHTTWMVNAQTLVPVLCFTEKGAEHYYIHINFTTPSVPLNTMTIKNDCLLQEIDNHSNIIYVNYKGEQRGFRLHKDRVRTSFDLV